MSEEGIEELVNEEHVEEIRRYINSDKNIQNRINLYVRREFFGEVFYAA